jgi:hypothetical protein
MLTTRRKEVEVFVLVATAGVGHRLACLLAEPSPRVVTALLRREKEGDRLGVAPMSELSHAASRCRCVGAAFCCSQWTWMPMRERGRENEIQGKKEDDEIRA